MFYYPILSLDGQYRTLTLDAFRSYLEERMRAGVWNARVLLREIRERGYSCCKIVSSPQEIGKST